MGRHVQAHMARGRESIEPNHTPCPPRRQNNNGRRMEALMIGVSGMRGTVGGTLTPPVVTRMAAAFAAWLTQNDKPQNGKHFRVVFGRDSRPSGFWVRDAAAAALVVSGIELIDLDV